MVTGSTLLQLCDGGLSDKGSTGCLFYIVGYLDGVEFGGMISTIQIEGYQDYDTAHHTHQRLVGFCVPENATNGQIQLVVTKYLRDHPERLHQSAKFLIPDAMTDAFPCPAS